MANDIGVTRPGLVLFLRANRESVGRKKLIQHKISEAIMYPSGAPCIIQHTLSVKKKSAESDKFLTYD